MIIRVENLVFVILNTMLLFFGAYCLFFSYSFGLDVFLDKGWFLSGLPIKIIGLFSFIVALYLYKKEFIRIINNKKK